VTLPPDALAGLLFQALLAGAAAGLLLRGRRLAAALVAGALAAGGVGLWLGEPGAAALAGALAAGLGALGPAAGSARSASRLGRLGRSDWSGGSKVVASERW